MLPERTTCRRREKQRSREYDMVDIGGGFIRMRALVAHIPDSKSTWRSRPHKTEPIESAVVCDSARAVR
jgi:hypothetical protein